MIKAEELRVGNIIGFYWNIYTKKEVNQSVIKEILEESLNVEISRNEMAKAGYEYFTGIPLTEYWLERFGFEYDTICWNKGILNLSKSRGDNYMMFIKTLTHGKIDGNEIQYVHQLQNIFHSLTGQEIIFKEK